MHICAHGACVQGELVASIWQGGHRKLQRSQKEAWMIAQTGWCICTRVEVHMNCICSRLSLVHMVHVHMCVQGELVAGIWRGGQKIVKDSGFVWWMHQKDVHMQPVKFGAQGAYGAHGACVQGELVAGIWRGIDQ